MDYYSVRSTKNTPDIHFHPDTFVLEIKGESYPANINEFYGPLITWLASFSATLTTDELIINFKLAYLNSSTISVLWNLFDLLRNRVVDGKRIRINWTYSSEDEDRRELGEDFREEFQPLPFNLVSKD